MICGCGCGQECKGQYVHGHNRKGKKISAETRIKLIKAHTGKKYSIESRTKMSESRKRLSKEGKLFSQETRDKLSKIHSGHSYAPATQFKAGNKGHLGYTLSQESRDKIRYNLERNRKISESRMGMKLSDEHKRKLKIHRSKQILPVKDSSIELKIQQFLKQLNIEFSTHQHIKEIEHGYQCDILVPSLNLVIECDGDYWHKYPVGREIDQIRTKELIDKGFKVLRLWERDIRSMILRDFENKLKSFI